MASGVSNATSRPARTTPSRAANAPGAAALVGLIWGLVKCPLPGQLAGGGAR